MDPNGPIVEQVEANLAAHLAHLPGCIEGAQIIGDDDLLVVDSGVPSDTFNTISRARLDPSRCDARIRGALRVFETSGHPFSWWVGPSSRPEDLGARLIRHGLTFAEAERAMWLDLAHLPPWGNGSPELDIRVATTSSQLADFACVVAANWDPPDAWVLAVYARAAARTLEPASPAQYFVGYVRDEPVAAVECFEAGGVAGIYNVTTLVRVRRRGFATAMMLAALDASRQHGFRRAVLQASEEGHGLYARLGFRTYGEFREYKP